MKHSGCNSLQSIPTSMLSGSFFEMSFYPLGQFKFPVSALGILTRVSSCSDPTTMPRQNANALSRISTITKARQLKVVNPVDRLCMLFTSDVERPYSRNSALWSMLAAAGMDDALVNLKHGLYDFLVDEPPTEQQHIARQTMCATMLEKLGGAPPWEERARNPAWLESDRMADPYFLDGPSSKLF